MSVVLPSARIFVGPGDELFGYDRIWVVLFAGADRPYHQNRSHYAHHLVKGRNGNDRRDLELLTRILEHSKKEDAYTELHDALQDGRDGWPRWDYLVSEEGVNAALRGDMPLVWTVDFDQDIIFYDRDGQHLMYRISMPEKGPLQLRHFQPYIPMDLPIQSCKESSTICSLSAAPHDVVPKPLFDLVYRLATDYEHNWRSSGLTVERDGLNHLAMGLLSCFTLNFEVQKIIAPNIHMYPYLDRVDPQNLLRWRAWPSPQVVTTISLGKTQVIFTERMDLATSLVHEHYANIAMRNLWDFENLRLDLETFGSDVVEVMRPSYEPFYLKVQYIVTSTREIQYFTKTHTNRETTLACTPIEPFFNGQSPPSETGVRWLLNVIHADTYPLHTPIHDLPLELQEVILEYARPKSKHNIFDRAIFAAKANIGLPFDFRKRHLSFATRELSMTRKLDPARPEYQLRIWGNYVGITYQVDDEKRWEYASLARGREAKWLASFKFNNEWWKC